MPGGGQIEMDIHADVARLSEDPAIAPLDGAVWLLGQFLDTPSVVRAVGHRPVVY